MSHNFLGPMFHGTSLKNADGILHSGSKPSWTGALGPGFYFTPEEEVADHYADSKASSGEGPAVLAGEVEVSNPIHFKDAAELWQKSNETGYATPAEYTGYLFRKGHDAVIAGRVGIVPKHGQFRPTALRGEPGEKWTDLT